MGLTEWHISNPHTPAPIYTIDELLRQRETDSDQDQTPLIAFPKSKLGVDDYEFFTGRDINRLVDGAVSRYLASGFDSTSSEVVVGIVGHSDLDFIVNVFALGRLGYTTLILSPRLDNLATLGLLQDLGATAFIYGRTFAQKAIHIQEQSTLKTWPLLTPNEYGAVDVTSTSQLHRSYDGPSENLKICIMMHSSGSTGKPRPIFYPNKRLLHVMINAQDSTAFLSVPLFHAHGLVSFLQAIYKRKTVYLFNGNVPQTHDTVTAAIKAAKPQLVWTVPYVLKLLAEKQDGIDALKDCRIVSCSGSRCPDELGDLMVRQGVHLGTSFGATEVAFVLTNLNRPRSDKYWDYMSAPPHVAPFVHMKLIEKDIFELVVLDGHKGKIMSNSNDPPNSFHTKDLFTPHWELKNRWKYVGRLDDRITLSNGEKFIPLDIEGSVRQSSLVKEAVVFGNDRPLPGLLLFRSEAAASVSDDQLVDRLWPEISKANTKVSAYGQIGRGYIAVLPSSTECPSTDKQSVKRAQVYRQFANVIDHVYEDNTRESKSLSLNLIDTESWLIQTFETEVGVILGNKETDFFAAGVDSQKAIQMRRVIVRSLDLGEHGPTLSSLVAFEHGNVARLAVFLHSLHTNQEFRKQNDLDIAKDFIKKYSLFERFKPGLEQPAHATILLTGATGSLGSTILHDLLANPSTQIYCPVRAKSVEEASSRLTSALSKSGYSWDNISLPLSVHGFPCDLLSFPSSVPKDILEHLSAHLTHVIHTAWPVNFSLGLSSFEPHLSTLKSLYDLTTAVKTTVPAQFLFCSSVGTAMASHQQTTVMNGPIEDMKQAAHTGYARSKLVAEKMLEAAHTANQNTTILRIGQIVPSTSKDTSKLWNPAETIPMIIQSVFRTTAIPSTPGPRAGDKCSWIPVDTLAGTVVDLAGLSSIGTTKRAGSYSHYNLVNPVPFSWSQKFLPLILPLLQLCLTVKIETTPFSTWFARLCRAYSPLGVVNNNDLSIKLIDIWNRDLRGGEQQQNEGQGDQETETMGSNQNSLIEFQTDAAFQDSQTFRTANWAMCTEEYVTALFEAWMEAWGKS